MGIQSQLPGPGRGLLARLVATVTGFIVLAGLFLAGLVAWVLLAGVVLIGSIVLSIWLWRARRRTLRQPAGESYLEVDYEVVEEREERP